MPNLNSVASEDDAPPDGELGFDQVRMIDCESGPEDSTTQAHARL